MRWSQYFNIWKVIEEASNINNRNVLYLGDSVDKLGLLSAVTTHTPPFLLSVRQLRVAGPERDEVAGVCCALGTPDTAEHRPQLGWV